MTSLHRDAERAHYLMQLGCYFTRLEDMDGIRFASTAKLSDIWYSQAYDIQPPKTRGPSLVKSINRTLKSQNRTPCVYLISNPETLWVENALRKSGYVIFEEEAWMFATPTKAADSSRQGVTIHSVSTRAELNRFIRVYKRGLPGPEVDKYIDSVVAMFCDKPAFSQFHYLYACYNGVPASMLSYHEIGNFAGIYAVATIPEYRRKGLARALLTRALELALSNGISHVFLQTVAGGDSEQVFKKCGFETLFTRKGFTTRSALKSLQHG